MVSPLDAGFINVSTTDPVRRLNSLGNRSLSDLLNEKLGGKEWLRNLSQLKDLRKFADDRTLQEKWMAIKLQNKVRSFSFRGSFDGIVRYALRLTLGKQLVLLWIQMLCLTFK